MMQYVIEMKAWNAITETTIRNCWRKCHSSCLDTPLVPSVDASTTHRLDTDNTIEEIQHFITQLGRMSCCWLPSIYIDDQLPTESFTDVIIATVQNNEEDKDESDKEYESLPIISLKAASIVDNLMRFCPVAS